MKLKTELSDQITALKLFNEKVSELINLSFVKTVTSSPIVLGFVGKRQDDGSILVSTTLNGPSKESIDAFVLTFRFFIQDNETTSLRSLATIYKSKYIDEQQRKLFESARNAVNNLLDSPSFMNISYENDLLTNRQIMEVFIYGGLAHAEPSKYKIYKDWMSDPPIKNLFTNCFMIILGKISQALDYIAQINKKTMKQLDALNC